MQAKEFTAVYWSGNANLLRLTLPLAASARSRVADSAFASFKTVEALLTNRGLYFIGQIKSATKNSLWRGFRNTRLSTAEITPVCKPKWANIGM